MIRVGVTENVIVSKAEKNEKGTLVIGVRELGTEVKEKKELSIAEQMAEGSDTTGADGFGELNFLMFMPSLTKFDKPEEPEEGPKVLASFIDLKNQLSHFLKRFLTDKQIKFAPFAGVTVNVADEKDIFAKIVTKAVAEKVYDNYITDFIKQITPFLNKEDKPGRLFLHRKSKASHFGVLRKKFLENQPFFESMEIPVNLSKMFTKQTTGTTKFHEAIEVEGIKYVPNFSSYELKNELDNTEKVEGADATQDAAQEIEDVQTLFNAGAGEDESTAPGEFKIEE